jgi:hypothetical protein
MIGWQRLQCQQCNEPGTATIYRTWQRRGMALHLAKMATLAATSRGGRCTLQFQGRYAQGTRTCKEALESLLSHGLCVDMGVPLALKGARPRTNQRWPSQWFNGWFYSGQRRGVGSKWKRATGLHKHGGYTAAGSDT